MRADYTSETEEGQASLERIAEEHFPPPVLSSRRCRVPASSSL